MTPGLTTVHHCFTPLSAFSQFSSKTLKKPSFSSYSLSKSISIPPFSTACNSSTTSTQYSVQLPSNNGFDQANLKNSSNRENSSELQSDWNVQVGSPNVAPCIPPAGFSLSDRAFFLLAFIVCTTSIGLASFVVAAASALHAMGRAAVSLSKLADTAREELPSTMAAVRLSGMEISDLTLELSDLSQEINDGMNKSAEVVQAAGAGIRQIGSLAHHQTMSMIEERAHLPTISIKPVVTGAAEKTYHAVGQAKRAVLSIFSRGEPSSKDEATKASDRLDT